MALKIRLKRIGAKRQPVYRFVVADVTSPRDGRHVEEIGYYDPLKNPAVIQVKEDRVLAWLEKGAMPTDTARALLSKVGVMAKFHEAKRAKPQSE